MCLFFTSLTPALPGDLKPRFGNHGLQTLGWNKWHPELIWALDRPKRIIKTLRFEHASQNASGFRISLYSIVCKWIFDTRAFSTQPKSSKPMCFASNRPCVLKTSVSERAFSIWKRAFSPIQNLSRGPVLLGSPWEPGQLNPQALNRQFNNVWKRLELLKVRVIGAVPLTTFVVVVCVDLDERDTVSDGRFPTSVLGDSNWGLFCPEIRAFTGSGARFLRPFPKPLVTVKSNRKMAVNVNGGHAGTKKGPNWGHVTCAYHGGRAATSFKEGFLEGSRDCFREGSKKGCSEGVLQLGFRGRKGSEKDSGS